MRTDTISRGHSDLVTTDRLFEAQVRATPHAGAVGHGELRLTYQEMEERVARFAGNLREAGVGPGSRVGLALVPGVERGIAIVATLRVGAAYVPLDPTYPRARLELMVEDADLTLVLASPAAVDFFRDGAPLAEVGAFMDRSPVETVCDSVARLADPAYVIYTSGSTGKPKGIVLPHRALANLMRWHLRQPGFDRPRRIIQFTPLSFDPHFVEMFAAWGVGGEVLFVDDMVRRDPPRLLSFMAENEIERIFLPAVALHQLAEVAITHGPLPASLKEVVTAGEQLQIDDILVTFFQRLPECRLHNHYGPAETHVVTAHTLEGEPASWPILPPIGVAIDETTIHVVGPDGAEVPPGEIGELCVSGISLADGYLGRPDLTAERFVPAPGRDGERMYRTGDLTRLDEEGRYQFLGRLDDQVKIRGMRVEPGEIEAEILKHPAVRECAVVARGGDRAGRSLVAYVVLDSHRPEVAQVASGLWKEKVSQWRDVWDRTYTSGTEGLQADMDLRGWVDSYSGRSIPLEEMEAWIDGTVRKALSVQPRRVLEVGTGTGLMLFRIAPHCTSYIGTDFSEAAVALLRRRVAGRSLCPDLRLEVADAAELHNIDDRDLDLVLMNSVTQNFPSVHYLLRVLRNAVRIVQRGHILVGDVTSAHLRDAFFTSVVGAEAGSDLPLASLRGRVERRLARDEELVIDPGFFARLGDSIPEIAEVKVELKPGRYRNELSRFRYDVLIRVGGEDREPLDAVAVPWDPQDPAPERLMALLEEVGGEAVALTGIPNARVREPVMAADLLRTEDFDTVGEWRTAVAERMEGSGVEGFEPDDFVRLGDRLGRPVEVRWGSQPDLFDVVVGPSGSESRRVRIPGPGDPRPLERLANQPLNVALMPRVEADLRRDLAHVLPEPLVPGRFEFLSRLPRTPSDKLDRRALPEPDRRRPELANEFVAPRGDTERELARLWAEILDLDRVGATDSFFDLGGNSILSVRLSATLRTHMARDLPLVALFQYPTVRSLASFLDSSSRKEDAAEQDDPDQRGKKQRQAFARSRRRRPT